MTVRQLNEFHFLKKIFKKKHQYSMINGYASFSIDGIILKFTKLRAVDDKAHAGDFRASVKAQSHTKIFYSYNFETVFDESLKFVNNLIDDAVHAGRVGHIETKPADLTHLSKEDFDLKKLKNDILRHY